MGLVVTAMMVAASVFSFAARPSTKAIRSVPAFSLKTMIPIQFANWREEPQRTVQVVNPQTEAMLGELYSEVLTRTYVNADGYRIMLSVVYGSDQRASFRAHDPEACYLGAGFEVHRIESTTIATPFGEIPVKRIFTSKGSREEPITYWWKVGDRAIPVWQRRLTELHYILTGRIPDGLLFRVSSIDPDQVRANQVHDQFINQLLQTVSPVERKRLSGLGDS